MEGDLLFFLLFFFFWWWWYTLIYLACNLTSNIVMNMLLQQSVEMLNALVIMWIDLLLWYSTFKPLDLDQQFIDFVCFFPLKHILKNTTKMRLSITVVLIMYVEILYNGFIKITWLMGESSRFDFDLKRRENSNILKFYIEIRSKNNITTSQTLI